jgi:hypothetical protein
MVTIDRAKRRATRPRTSSELVGPPRGGVHYHIIINRRKSRREVRKVGKSESRKLKVGNGGINGHWPEDIARVRWRNGRHSPPHPCTASTAVATTTTTHERDRLELRRIFPRLWGRGSLRPHSISAGDTPAEHQRARCQDDAESGCRHRRCHHLRRRHHNRHGQPLSAAAMEADERPPQRRPGGSGGGPFAGPAFLCYGCAARSTAPVASAVQLIPPDPVTLPGPADASRPMAAAPSSSSAAPPHGGLQIGSDSTPGAITSESWTG